MQKNRIILGVLEMIVALSAIPSGISMIFTPDGSGMGLDLAWLERSPFETFLVPGIFLLVFNGFLQFVGAWLTFRRNTVAGIFGVAVGLVLIFWLFAQVYYMDLTHFLQVVFFVVGLMEIYLGRKLA
ncbi:MAG: hypothetical protein OER83_01075 [Flavobacteriaceae bacterium]|nr:hypothetical protein [Flavobacteriaceae bacterium]MDH3795443.1 hypothetical protein [Flavobacteriaceae bacterium]